MHRIERACIAIIYNVIYKTLANFEAKNVKGKHESMVTLMARESRFIEAM